MSDWLTILKHKCEELGQAEVRRILSKNQPDGFPSASVINQVYKDKYQGRTERVKGLVEGIFMESTVLCPVYGDIPSDQCVEYQSKKYSGHNPMRVKIYKACRGGCEHSSLGAKS